MAKPHDGNAQRMRGIVIVADRAQLKPSARDEQEPRNRDHQNERHIDQRVLPEEGNVTEARNVKRG